MFKTRLLVLVLGLLAAPACAIPYPYNPHASNPQRDAWATNGNATATTENGTVVVLVIDQEALEALTRQAESQGRTVVQLRVEGENAGTGRYTGRVEEAGNLGGGVARAPRTQTPSPAPVTDVARGYGETSVRTPQPNVTPQSNAPQSRNGFAPVAQDKPVAQPAPVREESSPRRLGWRSVRSQENQVATVAQPAPRKQPLPQQPVANAPVPQQQAVTGPVANAPVVQPSPVSEPARPVTRVLRPTGPGTENGYSAYGSVTGSQGLRATGWNGGGSHRLSNLPHPSLFGNSAAQNGANNTTNPKKSGSSYWGPRK